MCGLKEGEDGSLLWDGEEKSEETEDDSRIYGELGDYGMRSGRV